MYVMVRARFKILTVCVSSPKAKHSLVVTYLHSIMIPLIEMVGNKMIFRYKKMALITNTFRPFPGDSFASKLVQISGVH